jgi:hypothetical protein
MVMVITYGYTDKHWRSSYMFYIGFTSASLDFLNYLRSTNTRLIGISKASIKSVKGACTLAYAKSDSHAIYKYIYYPNHFSSLTRKKAKLAYFVERDPTDILHN